MGKLGVIEMMFKPLRDWREAARGVRGSVLDYGHLLPEEAPEAKLRDLRRFIAHV
jgi:hypothetical protein